MESVLPPEAVTELLERWGGGDKEALGRLIPLVYQELHRLARSHLNREMHQQTIQATALVNEVYLRLYDVSRMEFKNRAHFYGAAATMIRRILVDRSRARLAGKRGSGQKAVLLNETAVISDSAELNYVDLHMALERLEQHDPRRAKVVELRYFAGLSVEQTAEVLDVSAMTVKREWNFARAWLYEQMTA